MYSAFLVLCLPKKIAGLANVHILFEWWMCVVSAISASGNFCFEFSLSCRVTTNGDVIYSCNSLFFLLYSSIIPNSKQEYNSQGPDSEIRCNSIIRTAFFIEIYNICISQSPADRYRYLYYAFDHFDYVLHLYSLLNNKM